MPYMLSVIYFSYANLRRYSIPVRGSNNVYSVKSITEIGPRSQKKNCHGQKRDYLSRVSQRARDATKK